MFGKLRSTGSSGHYPDAGKVSPMTKALTGSARRYRIEVRVTPEQDALIREAAHLEDTTVTAFMLDSVTAKASRVIESHRDLVLSNASFDRFIAELDKPAAPVPELVRLFRENPKLPEA
jgi:uncharacterized protein (DUF1778 family)